MGRMITVREKIESVSEEFKSHIISPAKVQAYRLHCPSQGGIFSCTIVFTDAGISILGDITPERNGSCTARAYGKNWFARAKSPQYLAEKFLTERFVPQYAAAELRCEDSWMREQIRDDHSIDDARKKQIFQELEDLANSVEDGSLEPVALINGLSDLGFECDEGVPGWDYCPREVGILAAIQQAFARLYAEMDHG